VADSINLALADGINPLAFIHNNKIVNENGSPIEFADHQFLLRPYADMTPEQVVMKPSQIGWSVCGINKSLWLAKYMKANIIYTMPSRTATKDFVSPKVDPIIMQNPVYQSWMGKTDSSALKAVGERFIYFRGSWEESAAISISADVLINDEVDRSNQKVLETYRTRLDASRRERPDLGFVWQWSNPSIPGYGVDENWQLSDQKHWFIRCPHCNFEWYLKFPENIDFEKQEYICTKCRKVLDREARRNGRWVVKNSKASISGYWISQLMMPWIPASEIIAKSKKDQSIFYNFTLGLPYISADQNIGRQTITRCIAPNLNPKTGVVMGVDNGVKKTVVIGNVHGIFKIYETESWEEIEEDFQRYGASMVIDANPYPNIPRKLAAKYPGRVFIHYFVQEQKSMQVILWGSGDKSEIVESDRTKIIDLIVSEFTNQEITFNMTLKELEDKSYIYDWSQLYRTVETNAQGIQKSVWRTIQDRRDHFAFATIYWRIALELLYAQGGVIRTPQKKQNSFYKKGVMVSPENTVPSVNLKNIAEKTMHKRKSWKTH
jgi:hypothetical protein